MIARVACGLMGMALLIVSGCTPISHSRVSPEAYWQNQQNWTNALTAVPAYPGYLEELNRQQLSPGDRVKITIAAGEHFNGLYEIDHDGTLRMPWITPTQVTGRTVEDVSKTLAAKLEDEGLFRRGLAYVTVQLHSWAPISVRIEGAVFNPGRVDISARSAIDRSERQAVASGEAGSGRRLSNAIAAAGGVRPDADIHRVTLIRNEVHFDIDLSGFLDGTTVIDPYLQAGDRLIIESSGYFSPALMRPLPITLPGLKIYASNLTLPASHNAGSALNEDAMSFPYGARFLQAAIKSNCVGGTQATSGGRHIVLISTDLITGKPVVIERSAGELVRNSNDTGINPWLMPGDTVSCYDSGVTNLRDVAKTITELVLPFSLF
ncbi:polysaccharide biosynthesis/export family protein [Larsenimonas suaedae]|uniref:Polysaccharide biosynthesis/export family protein n=1 Tax=Larsenimonas suaedae TaxID=1851019 RepID=A0ABU1GWG2_9GAMM|nr:polysaccharide biosynthesis/export family protein [Larsenimonas suaedae]MCM2971172.1 polysaccharide biosynthesis/export family protein [Larsenimonas suaedae]MDR5895881.1 polysaccharide biosynthesis/export family protein [Larsenimonas suaedae]